MKFVIDLIEDIRASIANHPTYTFGVGLLKKDPTDSTTMHYAGESPLNWVSFDSDTKQLCFGIDGSSNRVRVEELLPSLVIADMESMMYPLVIDVNAHHKGVEVIGFGKNDAEQRYLLFITLE